jgi:hypothetical protein
MLWWTLNLRNVLSRYGLRTKAEDEIEIIREEEAGRGKWAHTYT